VGAFSFPFLSESPAKQAFNFRPVMGRELFCFRRKLREKQCFSITKPRKGLLKIPQNFHKGVWGFSPTSRKFNPVDQRTKGSAGKWLKFWIWLSKSVACYF